jgi:hypothetical protein
MVSLTFSKFRECVMAALHRRWDAANTGRRTGGGQAQLMLLQIVGTGHHHQIFHHFQRIYNFYYLDLKSPIRIWIRMSFFCRKFFLVFLIRIHLIRIRIQHFRQNTDPYPDPGFFLTTIKWKKITAEKI